MAAICSSDFGADWNSTASSARPLCARGEPRYERPMKVDGRHTRTIWVEPDGWSIGAIDQTLLPHRFASVRLTTLAEAARAIKSMQVRGAPLIGAAAAYGACLAPREDASATAPISTAYDHGVPVHVWVDETRPRNQGAALTAWELGQHGVPHTVIADNTGGHLMQHGMVDIAIVGTDRVTATGDVCNKIGTYLKALAAKDNGVPFYVALPSPTIDFSVSDGVAEIPIEERAADEVATISGRTADGRIETVRLVPDGSAVANYGFDVTPARLVTGLITERGVIAPTRAALAEAFRERTAAAE